MSFFKYNKLFGIFILALTLGSCGTINSNMMFKTPKDGSFKYDSIPMRPKEDYKISIDDKIAFSLSTNAGKNLIEILSGTSTAESGITSAASSTEFLVKSNGFVELPVLGDVNVVGLTLNQFQDTLEILFAKQYNDPFIQAKITNQRCIIFPGSGSDARILQIQNNHTTLMEIIAQSGGIPARGRSRTIKIMRKVEDKREVYLVDISTIDGLKYADMIIQGNDYIYIEPNPQLLQGTLASWAPISSLISSVVILYTVFSKFN